jgi:UPF0716 protein FxsA
MTLARIGCTLVAWPFVEVIIMVWVAATWGWELLILLILASVITGLVTIRVGINRTGRSWTQALRTLQQRSAANDGERVSGPELELSMGDFGASTPDYAPPAQTVLLIPAGIAIAIPGFLSDIAGLIVLIPAVRRRIAARWATGWQTR